MMDIINIVKIADRFLILFTFLTLQNNPIMMLIGHYVEIVVYYVEFAICREKENLPIFVLFVKCEFV
jgi:hypothetical protein